MNKNVRKVTNDVIIAVEEGLLSWEAVAMSCLAYMGEYDVADMVRLNDWEITDDEEEEENE